MFERFSKEARDTVAAAQQIARDTSTTRIDARHLLVALAERPGPARDALRANGVDTTALAQTARRDLLAGGLDGAALASLGIDLDAVRRRAEETFGPDALDGAARRPSGHIPFGREAKKILELALREAVRLRSRTIHDGLLLLGLLRTDSSAGAVLEQSRVDVVAVRSTLEAAAAA